MGNVNTENRQELITKKAYEIFVERGSKPGNDLDDWLTAEKMVDGEIQQKSPNAQGRSRSARGKSRKYKNQ